MTIENIFFFNLEIVFFDMFRFIASSEWEQIVKFEQ
jgi:hypothetical protein